MLQKSLGYMLCSNNHPFHMHETYENWNKRKWTSMPSCYQTYQINKPSMLWKLQTNEPFQLIINYIPAMPNHNIPWLTVQLNQVGCNICNQMTCRELHINPLPCYTMGLTNPAIQIQFSSAYVKMQFVTCCKAISIHTSWPIQVQESLVMKPCNKTKQHQYTSITM